MDGVYARKDSLFDYGILNAFPGMGMAKGEKLEEFVRTKIATTNIESMKLPLRPLRPI